MHQSVAGYRFGIDEKKRKGRNSKQGLGYSYEGGGTKVLSKDFTSLIVK